MRHPEDEGWFVGVDIPSVAGIIPDVKGPAMYAMVVRMSLDPDRRSDVIAHLRRDVVGFACGLPGFVSGQWFCSTDGVDGLGVVLFDAEADVVAAARGPRATQHDVERAWNIENVQVFEQVARAERAGGADIPDGMPSAAPA